MKENTASAIIVRDIDAWCKGLQTGLDLREFGQHKVVFK